MQTLNVPEPKILAETRQSLSALGQTTDFSGGFAAARGPMSSRGGVDIQKI